MRTVLLLEALPRGSRRRIVRCFGTVQAARIAALSGLLLASTLPTALAVIAVLPLAAVLTIWRSASRLVLLALIPTLAKVAAVATILGALGAPAPLEAALAVVPALELAALVPLTPANLGVATAAAAVALHAVGLPKSEAVEAGIVLHAIATAAAIGYGSVATLFVAIRLRQSSSRGDESRRLSLPGLTPRCAASPPRSVALGLRCGTSWGRRIVRPTPWQPCAPSWPSIRANRRPSCCLSSPALRASPLPTSNGAFTRSGRSCACSACGELSSSFPAISFRWSMRPARGRSPRGSGGGSKDSYVTVASRRDRKRGLRVLAKQHWRRSTSAARRSRATSPRTSHSWESGFGSVRARASRRRRARLRACFRSSPWKASSSAAGRAGRGRTGSTGGRASTGGSAKSRRSSIRARRGRSCYDAGSQPSARGRRETSAGGRAGPLARPVRRSALSRL